MNLVIDIGNTVAKIAVFRQNELYNVVYTDNRTLSDLIPFASRYQPVASILSSVVDLSEEAEKSLAALSCPLLRLTYQTPLPIKILYETPQTLGGDRIAAVVGATYLKPGRDILVIDAGTCITYELVDSNSFYYGGNISPGLEMRLKALNNYTGKLPLVQSKGVSPMIGKNTETAIRAGVIRGIKYEIEGYIRTLNHKYPELLVFLTGGDEISFDANLKSRIFADKFLVLKGLNRILDYNNDKV
ncbi:MAG: type III pantothenate kinase [Mediterranea massiliensis]|nr:type III pantothenate kinase [Mediterranea massiliensis]